MLGYPRCEVITEGGNQFDVAGRHYEQLKDMLDHKDKGWIELDLALDPSAHITVKLDEIVIITYLTEQFMAAKQAAETVEGG